MISISCAGVRSSVSSRSSSVLIARWTFSMRASRRSIAACRSTVSTCCPVTVPSSPSRTMASSTRVTGTRSASSARPSLPCVSISVAATHPPSSRVIVMESLAASESSSASARRTSIQSFTSVARFEESSGTWEPRVAAVWPAASSWVTSPESFWTHAGASSPDRWKEGAGLGGATIGTVGVAGRSSSPRVRQLSTPPRSRRSSSSPPASTWESRPGKGSQARRPGPQAPAPAGAAGSQRAAVAAAAGRSRARAPAASAARAVPRRAAP